MILINETYRQQLRELHQNPKKFGRSGEKKFNIVKSFIEEYRPTSLIDFGCSQGELLPILAERYNINAMGYDPGVPKFEVFPTDVVECLTSTDVLEHVEPELLDATLKAISNMFTKSAFLLIASYPAKKRLPDGRNAHLIIESFDWWRNKLKTCIAGNIVASHSTEVIKTPKKGPQITGYNFTFVIEK